MKDNGSMVFLKAKESRNSRMEQSLMECGRKDCQKDKAYASIQMEVVMTGTGKKASHTVWARRLYLMAQLSMADGSKEKLEVMGLKFYLMVLCLKENGKKVVF